MCRFIVAVWTLGVLATSVSAQDRPAASGSGHLLGEEFPLFAHFNVGAQSQTEGFRQGAAFPLYDETASWDVAHAFEGGTTFDIGGGVGLRKFSSLLHNASVGVTFTARSKHRRDVAVNAQVPHPLFTDSARSAVAEMPGFHHSEKAVHFQMLYEVPILTNLGVTVFVGPSIFSVRDEFIEAVTITEVGGDLSAVNIDTARSGQQKTVGGFNLGLDVRYTLLRNLTVFRELGLGALLRYSRGSVNLTLPSDLGGTHKFDAGGPEFGGGLRLAF